MARQEVQLDKVQTKALAAMGWASPVDFARIFLPQWFPNKMPWVHRGLLAVMTKQVDFLLKFGQEEWAKEWGEWTPAELDLIVENFTVHSIPGDLRSPEVPIFHVTRDETGLPIHIELAVSNQAAVVMPRGFSKTTLVNMVNIRDIVYAVRKFILYISDTAAQAERQLRSVRKQLEENHLLIMVFGDLQPERTNRRKWTDSYIETMSDIKVGALGRGGQIRGIAEDAERPDRVIVDDVEDNESAGSETQREATKTWFMGTLMPALADVGDIQSEIFFVGTILHKEALLPSIGADPEWMWLKFSALDKRGNPIWPLKMDLVGLERKRKSFAALGQLVAFHLEYLSNSDFNEGAIFDGTKFVHVHKGMDLFSAVALACDPAISAKSSADMCGFGVVGIEPGGCCHVLDVYGRVGMKPNEQVDKWFELHFRWLASRDPSTNRHGIEAIAYQRALISMVQARMYQETETHGYSAYHEIEPIMHGKQGKSERVLGILQPRFKSGYLTFGSVFADLEIQMLEWPSNRKDLPDVVSMAIKLLDPYAMLNIGPGFDPEADTAESLDKVIGGAFGGAP